MPFDPLGLAENHPEFIAMDAAIKTEGAMMACIKATQEGQPAIVGVDSMLTALFVRYREKHHYVLKNAGFLVARHMKKRGYKEVRKGACPAGCSAGTGAVFLLEAGEPTQ